MLRLILSFFMTGLLLPAFCQFATRGTIIDDKTNLPIAGATVTLTGYKLSAISDDNGRFFFRGRFDSSSTIVVNTIGYAEVVLTLSALAKLHEVHLVQKQIELQDVVVVANGGDQFKPISKTRYCHARC